MICWKESIRPILRAGSAAPVQQSRCDEGRDADDPQRPEPEPGCPPGEWRDPAAALDFAREHAARVTRQRLRHTRAMVDDGGGAGVGARITGRSNSSARMRLICRCWSIATESPNQPMLLTFTKIVGA